MFGNPKTACGIGSVYTVVTRCCNEMRAKTAVHVLLLSKITFFFSKQLQILRLLMQSELLVFVNSLFFAFNGLNQDAFLQC